MHCIARTLIPWLLIATPLSSQSLAQRVKASDGPVQVVYPSRANACGDGQGFIGNVFREHDTYIGEGSWTNQRGWPDRACLHGPARVVVTVLDGEVTRVRTFVGPLPQQPTGLRTIDATPADAALWLGELAAHAPSSRVASDAMLPLIVADTDEPWPLLLKIARDESRPRDVRQSALSWLSNGVNEHLGIADASYDDSDEDQMRTQAVYTLTQRPKSESVPQLIALARGAKYPAVRRAAIYWLGQVGDPAAVGEVYAELLGVR